MECQVQRELIDELRKEGIMALKLDPGTGTIPKGWPDLVCLYPNGTVKWVEVKDFGGKVSVQQRRHMLMLHLAGHNVCFVDPTLENNWPRLWAYEEIAYYVPPKH